VTTNFDLSARKWSCQLTLARGNISSKFEVSVSFRSGLRLRTGRTDRRTDSANP